MLRSRNTLECAIRSWLMEPDTVQAAAPAMLQHFSLGEILLALDEHSFMRMVPADLSVYRVQEPGPGSQPEWRPEALDQFRENAWWQDAFLPARDGAGPLVLEERHDRLVQEGAALHALIQEAIQRETGATQYTLALYGAFIYRISPPTRDLDVIAVTHGGNDQFNPAYQVFGSQELEVDGLRELCPWMRNDLLDLNVISTAALDNPRSETAMSMRCTLDGSLFVVGERPAALPAYLRLFHIYMMWSRQSWTVLGQPQGSVLTKMRHRAHEVRWIMRKIVQDQRIILAPAHAEHLDSTRHFDPKEFDTGETYFIRTSVRIGELCRQLDTAMKRRTRETLERIAGRDAPHGGEGDMAIKVAHVKPDPGQTCGISKYSLAFHDALGTLPGLTVKAVDISEAHSTEDEGHLLRSLEEAVAQVPQILHLHFADGLLRKNRSEAFVEFSAEHQAAMLKAHRSVATIYELGPRMLSANRLPQDIEEGTDNTGRQAIMSQLRKEMSRLLDSLDGVLVHSPEQWHFLMDDPLFGAIVARRGVSVEVMRHGIPAPHAQYTSHRKQWRGEVRERWRIPPDALVMIQFGFIRSNKQGFDLFEVLRRVPEAVWLLAGGPRQESHRPFMEALGQAADRAGVGERCVMTGSLEDDEISRYFAAADLAIIPYKNGTESYVMATSLGHGMPVVGSYLPFICEAQARYGDVVWPSPTVDDFCRRLHELKEPELCDELSRLALAAAGRDSWARVARRTARFYARLLAVNKCR